MSRHVARHRLADVVVPSFGDIVSSRIVTLPRVIIGTTSPVILLGLSRPVLVTVLVFVLVLVLVLVLVADEQFLPRTDSSYGKF